MDLRRLVLRVLYWLAVLAVSLAIVFGLILLLESRDSGEIEGGAWLAPFGLLQPGEHDQALGGAVERVARAQH